MFWLFTSGTALLPCIFCFCESCIPCFSFLWMATEAGSSMKSADARPWRSLGPGQPVGAVIFSQTMDLWTFASMFGGPVRVYVSGGVSPRGCAAVGWSGMLW
jgi:hypothetical protein